MRLSNLKWIKNVRHQDNNRKWAYDKPAEMPISEAKIFCLNWRTPEHRADAEKPRKGELMLLLQNATVTHLVEFVDSDVCEKAPHEWGIYRVVKALWMPPTDFNWSKLPHQREYFGFDYVVGDGIVHDVATDGKIDGKMPKFHQYWDEKGGLEAFQKHIDRLLTKISPLASSM